MVRGFKNLSELPTVFFFFLFLNFFCFFCFSQELSDCWWSGCRVATQRPGHRSFTLAIDDPAFSHIGLPLPQNPAPAKHPQTKRPQEDKFVILECEPEKNLQEGDILLEVNPISKEPEHAFDLLMKTPHAAIVAKKPDGSLYALGTPRNYWPEGKLRHTSYHVIRLREFPKEVTSPQVLAEWRKNPSKYARIRDWEQERRVILEKVKSGISFFEKNVPFYDSERKTEILDPQFKKLFSEWILNNEECDAVPSQYCSELVATIYAVAGVHPPQTKPHHFYLTRLEKEVIPFFKKGNETDRDVFTRSMKAFFNSTDLWINLGVSEEERDRILEERDKTRNPELLPETVKKTKDYIEWIWGFPPFMRNQIIYWSGALGDKKGVITPLDFLNTIQDHKGEFSYVGTYLKGACENPVKGPTTRHLIH